MKTIITDSNNNNAITKAYTFFGIRYAVVKISNMMLVQEGGCDASDEVLGGRF